MDDLVNSYGMYMSGVVSLSRRYVLSLSSYYCGDIQVVVYGDVDVDRDRECGWVSLDLFRLGLNMMLLYINLLLLLYLSIIINTYNISREFYILIITVFIYLWTNVGTYFEYPICILYEIDVVSILN